MARLLAWSGSGGGGLVRSGRAASHVSLSCRRLDTCPPLLRPCAAPPLNAWPGAGSQASPCSFPSSASKAYCQRQGKSSQGDDTPEAILNFAFVQACLWALVGVYVLWLFILPYAPGDPVWAIKLDTISMVLDESLNFLFILPLINMLGIHLVESPAVHPTAEALFNFVMGWSLMFAPLLFIDKGRKRFSGSLAALWGIQMFLTNTVLIPYMAIRLKTDNSMGDTRLEAGSRKLILRGVERVMVSGAKVVSLMCGIIGIVAVLWFFLGRADEGFGNFSDRRTFFLEYLASDRVGYAFIWDLCLYSLFQPWLIGDNLDRVEKSKAEMIGYLRYIPYVGLVVYLWGLNKREELES